MTRTLGKYELLRNLDSGGVAQIHIAKQRGVEGFEKLVVIKLLLPKMARNPQVVKLFLNEAKLAARLSHQNVVQILDLGKAEGEYFIAMEYIAGENLATIRRVSRKTEAPLTMELILGIMRQALEGLNYAHTKKDALGRPLNIVHCDVSPQNILVSYEGVVKLVDFGIAKAEFYGEEDHQQVIGGKVTYMSPEQSKSVPVNDRSDLFSLGIVFWELVAGRRIYGRMTPQEIFRSLPTAKMPLVRQVNPSCPPEVEAIIAKAVEKNRWQRFESTYEMLWAVGSAIKKLGLSPNTMKLGAYMKDLFIEKLDNLRQVEQAQEAGSGLDETLFDGLELDEDTGSPTPSVDSSAQPLILEPAEQPAEPAEEIAPRHRQRRFHWKLILVIGILAAGLVLGTLFRAQLAALLSRLAPGDGESSRIVLKVRSTPTGASVSVNGTRRCETPCEIPDLKAGSMQIVELNAPGHEAWTRQLELDDSETVRKLHAVLTRGPERKLGSVDAGTRPPKPRVVLDRKPVRRKIPPATGTGKTRLSVDALPSAIVYLDEVKIGMTPVESKEISAGTHLLELKNPETRWVESLVIEAKEGRTIDEFIEFPEGTLDIDSEPGAYVYIFGRKYGTTPYLEDLTAGTYKITVVNHAQNLRETRQVVVKPEETTTVMFKLKK